MSEIQPILSPEIQRLSIEAIDFARQARADSTLKVYRTDWRLFERFCQTHGLVALPADASTIALFITSLAEENRPSTIRRKLAALSVALEMRSRATYRGFESHPVRHFLCPLSDSLQPSLVLGCVAGFNRVLLIS